MSLYEKLDSNQKRAVRLAIRRKSALIFFEQGVGKTHPCLSIVEILAEEDSKFVGMLIVPLTNLETTWIRLIKQELKINYTTDWDKFKELPSPKLLLTHFEGLPKLKSRITKFKWTFAAVDESQRIKARSTRQSRICGALKSCEYRVALSGTPTDGDPIDLWAQLRFAVPQLFGNDRSAWRRFAEEYLKKTGYMGYKWKFDKNMLEPFLEKIKLYCIRVTAKSLNIPKMTNILVPVIMKGEQERVYRDMERDFVAKIIKEAKRKADIKSKRLGKPVAIRASAGLTITQMIKLQQICGGHLVDDDGDIHFLGSVKIKQVEHLLKTEIKPFVIFAKYKPEIELLKKLCDRLGLKHRTIWGKVRDKEILKRRTNAQILFQAGKLDVIICQIKSGGVGIDLYTGRTAIVYSTTFSYIDYDQCRKRIERRGQVNKTKLFFVYTKDSIDEDIYSTILSKRSVTKTIFKQMKQRSKSWLNQK